MGIFDLRADDSIVGNDNPLPVTVLPAGLADDITLVAIAPSTVALSSGQNLLAPAPAAGFRNRIVAAGFQNRGTATRDLTLKHGTTAMRKYSLAAGATLEFGPDECLSWDFGAEEAFDADASAASDLWCTGGRYYVAAA